MIELNNEEQNTRRCIVIFDSKYGNTEKIARSLETGLKGMGFETACINVKDVAVDSLEQFDLICVGGPTQYRTTSPPMQTFLSNLKTAKVAGKQGFAFDTRRDSYFAGSAAANIEERLREIGLKIVMPRSSAIIVSSEVEKKKSDFENKDEWKEWKRKSVELCEGEEERFEQVGSQLRAVVTDTERKMPYQDQKIMTKQN